MEGRGCAHGGFGCEEGSCCAGWRADYEGADSCFGGDCCVMLEFKLVVVDKFMATRPYSEGWRFGMGINEINETIIVSDK